jgi:hypothetical protein
MAILNKIKRKDNVFHWSLLGRQRPTHMHKTIIRSNTGQGFKHGDWKKRLLWKMKIANP